MIGVIVLKQFQKFVKVKNGTPFKNSLFFYFMLIHHLSNVEHGLTIRESDKVHGQFFKMRHICLWGTLCGCFVLSQDLTVFCQMTKYTRLPVLPSN